MTLKRINPIILADALAGLGEVTGVVMRGEFENDPRLLEMYWFLQSLNATELHELVDRVPGRYETESSCLPTPKGEFVQTLKFLFGESDRFRHAGKCAPEIATAIRKQMEQHAKQVKASLADTKVSRTIFKELDLALQHKVPVPIIGDSRFGKTKGVSVWSAMRPGRCRVVTLPPSNRDWDFFAAHADAFGIEYTDRTPAPRLKRQVEYVMQTSGLFVIYDEAHFLVPVNYYKDTPPKRINWVRCQVIDKGIGCAFFATPQSMDQTLERFAAKTKYNFEQWLGRLAPPVVLANYYGRDELMAVAKIHFPDFEEDLLALICARAMQSEGYLKSMEFTARYATALAQDRGHKTPTEKDVDESIERMMLAKAPVPASRPPLPRRVSRPLKAPLMPPSETLLDGTGDGETPEDFRRHKPARITDSARAITPRARGDLVAA